MSASVDFRSVRWELEATDRPMLDKRMSATKAMELVHDGDHVAIGGTLYSRTPMALVFALLKTRRRHLTISRPLTCYEAELFYAAGMADRVITSWIGIGLKWGLPQIMRHYVETGQAVYEEWSHLGIGLRYKAGAMGVPFLPALTMLGSDIARTVELREVDCPYTGQRLAALPALNPDVALIHAHRSDIYGNVQVDGYRHMDVDMARAARRVIVSVEQIVSSDEIRALPTTTILPHFAVDAIVEAPFGAYPSECYGLYHADLRHFDEYVNLVKAKGPDGAREYIAEHVDQHDDFAGFLASLPPGTLDDLVAAAKRLAP